MSGYDRRAEDNEAFGMKLLKFWPLILALSTLVGSAYVAHSDLGVAKKDIAASKETAFDHEKRIIRVETALAVLPEMRQDLKEINTTLNRIARRRGDNE